MREKAPQIGADCRLAQRAAFVFTISRGALFNISETSKVRSNLENLRAFVTQDVRCCLFVMQTYFDCSLV